MASEEKNKVELWAEATKRMAETDIQNNNKADVEKIDGEHRKQEDIIALRTCNN